MRKKDILSLVAGATIVASPAMNTFATTGTMNVDKPISTEVKSTEDSIKSAGEKVKSTEQLMQEKAAILQKFEEAKKAAQTNYTDTSNKIDSNKADVENYKAEIARLAKEFNDKKQKLINDKKDAIKSTENNIKELKKTKAELEKNLEAANKALEQAQNDYDTEVADNKAMKAELAKAQEALESAQKVYDEKQSALNELLAQKTAAESELNSLNEQKKGLSDQIADLNKGITDNQNKINDIDATLTGLKEQLTNEEADQSNIEKEIQATEANKSALETELNNSKTELATAEAALAETTAKYNKLAADNKELIGLTETEDTLKSKLNTAQSELNEANAKLQASQTTYDTKKAAYESAKAEADAKKEALIAEHNEKVQAAQEAVNEAQKTLDNAQKAYDDAVQKLNEDIAANDQALKDVANQEANLVKSFLNSKVLPGMTYDEMHAKVFAEGAKAEEGSPIYKIFNTPAAVEEVEEYIKAGLTLENFNKALKMVDEFNWLRANAGPHPVETEKGIEYIDHIKPVKISYDMMMMSIFSTAISTAAPTAGVELNHHGAHFLRELYVQCGENLAWGYNLRMDVPNDKMKNSSSPFDGWYYDERKSVETNDGGQTGHYYNVIGNDKYIGSSHLNVPNKYCATGQMFNGEWAIMNKLPKKMGTTQTPKTATYEEAKAEFEKFSNDVLNRKAELIKEKKRLATKEDLNAPKQALDAAKSALTNKKKTLSDLQAITDFPVDMSKVESTKKAMDDFKPTLDKDINAQKAKQSAFDEAKAAHKTAKEALDKFIDEHKDLNNEITTLREKKNQQTDEVNRIKKSITDTNKKIADNDSTLATQKEALNKAKAAVKATNNKIAENTTNKGNLQKAITESQTSIDELNNSVNDIDNKIPNVEKTLADLDAPIKDKTSEVEASKPAVKAAQDNYDKIIAAYMNKERAWYDNSIDPKDTDLDKFVKAAEARLKNAKTLKNKINSQIEDKTNNLTTNKAELEKLNKELDELLKIKDIKLDDESTYTDDMKALAKKITDTEAETAALQENLPKLKLALEKAEIDYDNANAEYKKAKADYDNAKADYDKLVAKKQQAEELARMAAEAQRKTEAQRVEQAKAPQTSDSNESLATGALMTAAVGTLLSRFKKKRNR